MSWFAGHLEDLVELPLGDGAAAVAICGAEGLHEPVALRGLPLAAPRRHERGEAGGAKGGLDALEVAADAAGGGGGEAPLLRRLLG